MNVCNMHNMWVTCNMHGRRGHTCHTFIIIIIIIFMAYACMHLLHIYNTYDDVFCCSVALLHIEHGVRNSSVVLALFCAFMPTRTKSGQMVSAPKTGSIFVAHLRLASFAADAQRLCRIWLGRSRWLLPFYS